MSVPSIPSTIINENLSTFKKYNLLNLDHGDKYSETERHVQTL